MENPHGKFAHLDFQLSKPKVTSSTWWLQVESKHPLRVVVVVVVVLEPSWGAKNMHKLLLLFGDFFRKKTQKAFQVVESLNV